MPTAAGAATPSLTEARARPLALKLARLAAERRDATHWTLSPALKVRRTRVVFGYLERDPDDRFCTGRIAVTQSGSRRRAELTNVRCRPVPQQVLAIEGAVRAAIRAVEPKVPDVRSSNQAYERSQEECEELEVPAARQDDVDLLHDLGGLVALWEPVLAELDAFSAQLQEIGPTDRDLARGVIAWPRLLRLLRGLPEIVRDSCPAVLRWADEGYDPASAPADFDALRDVDAALGRQARAMRGAGVRLTELGVPERYATAFDANGLVIQAAAR